MTDDPEALQEMNRTQEETIKTLWCKNERLTNENARLRQRCETQQGMIDYLRKQAAPPTAEQVAEQLFKGAENG